MTTATPEIKTEHLAVSALRDQESVRTDVRRLQEIKRANGAAALFRDESMPDQDQAPDFESIKKMLDKMDPEDRRKPALQAKLNEYQRLAEGSISNVHLQMAGKIAAEMRGLIAAISHELGNPDWNYIADRLRNGTFTNDARFRGLVEKWLKDPEFIKKLNANINKQSPDEALVKSEQAYDALKKDVDAKQSTINVQKSKYLASLAWYDDMMMRHPGDLVRLENDARLYDSFRDIVANRLPEDLRMPEEIPSAELQGYITKLTTASTGTYTATEKSHINRALAYAQRLNDYFNTKPFYFTDDNLRFLRLSKEANTEIARLNADQAALDAKRVEQAVAEVAWRNGMTNYARKVDLTLETAFKQYYNDILLKEARQLAADELKQKEMPVEKVAKIDAIFDRFSRLAYFRYDRAGNVKGFDDKWIRKASRAVKARGPEGMARLLAQRIVDQKRKFDPTLRAEIDRLLAEINPASPNNPLDAVALDYLQRKGTVLTPQIVGYAYARSHWWDRMHFNSAQLEFAKLNYDENFWSNVLTAKAENKERNQKIIDDVFGKGVLTLDQTLKEQLRKNLQSAKSPEFMRKLMKVLPWLGLGAIGVGSLAGLYFGIPAAYNAVVGAGGIAGLASGAAAEVGKAVNNISVGVSQLVGGVGATAVPPDAPPVPQPRRGGP